MNIRPTRPIQTDAVKFTGRKFKKKHFSSEESASGYFRNCVFQDCEFENLKGFFLYFSGCQFNNCFFNNNIFSHIDMEWEGNVFDHCNIRNTHFEEGMIFDTLFTETEFYNTSFSGIYPFENVCFDHCSFSFVNFRTVSTESVNNFGRGAKQLQFKDCNFSFTLFENSDLRESCFSDSFLWGLSVINSKVSAGTFFSTNKFDEKNPGASIVTFDLRTIKESLPLNKAVLQKHFHIYDDHVVQAAKALEAKQEYYSAFISYSFKDAEVVARIHKFLLSKNITCFLWAKDAPGGRFMKSIMASEIKKHEKILFISSSHSLKSEACQFELSEGRTKQDQDWSEVFVPVVIDDYLFSVQQHQVRPIDKAAEYWKNITELRNINCIDATGLSKPAGRTKVFAAIIAALCKK